MVCVGTSPLQEDSCFFFRLPATYSAGDGKYLKSGAPASPTAASSEGEGEEKAEHLKDAKGKDPIILLRCTSTAERDRWIQAFVDLGVKKAHGKDKSDKPELKPDEKVQETAKGEKSESGEKAEKAEKADAPASTSDSSSTSTPSSSSSSASSTPTLLPVQDD